jgi:membrane protease YdiL (CAAX protease family)
MLFLLKRSWQTALAGLIVLTALGLGLRALLPEPTPLGLSAEQVLLGVAVFAAVLGSDALLHGLLLLLFGAAYRRRHRQLVEVFRGQGGAALLLGALMAGVGEELVFRGVGTEPLALVAAAVLFGLLHHLLWPFTLWAVYQGLLFALAVHLTQALTVTMVAHFLHDLAGFLLFAHLNRRPATRTIVPGTLTSS